MTGACHKFNILSGKSSVYLFVPSLIVIIILNSTCAVVSYVLKQATIGRFHST